MITIRTTDFWINEPIEAIFEKLRWETHVVKFGPLNVYNTKHQNLTKTWLGELHPKSGTFKVFRVTGNDNTSDMSVHGEYTTRLGKPLIRVKFKVHFTAFLGLFGVLTCLFALWYLLNKKGIMMGEWVLIVLLLMVGGYYSVVTMRDLSASEQAIESLIYKTYPENNDIENSDKNRYIKF